MRTCDRCGSRMPPYVPRKTIAGQKVCEGCQMWHSKTGSRKVAVLHNPTGELRGQHPEEWYHGSGHEFENFGHPGGFHWNTLLGHHFSAQHEIAQKFASGEGSDWDEGDDEPVGHMVHARLHLKRPKTYRSEHDMDQEVYEHERAQGNHIDNHLAKRPDPHDPDGLYADDEDEDDWYDPEDDDLHHAKKYAGDSQQKYTANDQDHGYYAPYRQFHPVATGWLNSHPDKDGIAARYKQRLKDQGYDGIVYGNAFEQTQNDKGPKHPDFYRHPPLDMPEVGEHNVKVPQHSISAIAFEPHQIEITQHHYGDECKTPHEIENDKHTDPLPHWRSGWGQPHLPGMNHTSAKYTHKVTRYAPQGGYEEVEKEIEGPLYHGGRANLSPGDLITRGRKPNSWGDEGPKSTHVYFSTDRDTAASYSQQLGNKGHLYEVEPTGEFKPDYGPQDYKTPHPLRVIRKVPREEWQLGSTASNSNDPWRWEQHQTRWDTKRPAIEHTKDLGAFTLHAEPVNEDGDREIHAVTPEGRYIGSTYFGQHPSLTSYQEGAPEVHPDHRRRGVASAMYDWAEELGGKPMAPAVSHTEDAAGFWSTRKQATVYPGHETALHEMGQQTVYPVSTPRGVTNLCQHHLNVHQSISAGSNDLAGHLGIPQAPSEPLGASKTGTCADCNKNTDYMLKLQRPEGFDRQRSRDSKQPKRPGGAPYVPSKTKPLPSLRQSENAITTVSGSFDNGIGRSSPAERQQSVVIMGSNGGAPGQRLDHLRASEFPQVEAVLSTSLSKKSVSDHRTDTQEKIAMSKLPTLRMLAHDATENQEIRHCPFCGGGKIIGRQDGTVECEFCHQFFTVQVQPQFPNFPQTIDGQPQQIPGMPGQVETPSGASGGGFPPGEEDAGDPAAEGENPFADGDTDDAGGPPDGDADDKGGDEPPPFAKKSFRTAQGALLDEDNYARHLAIRLAPDRAAMISVIRDEQGAQ